MCVCVCVCVCSPTGATAVSTEAVRGHPFHSISISGAECFHSHRSIYIPFYSRTPLAHALRHSGLTQGRSGLIDEPRASCVCPFVRKLVLLLLLTVHQWESYGSREGQHLALRVSRVLRFASPLTIVGMKKQKFHSFQ